MTEKATNSTSVDATRPEGGWTIADLLRFSSFPCVRPEGVRQMAYTEWGDPQSPHIVFCVHGLTRNGRDFDSLAKALSAQCRVICPDVLGRGRSDWLNDPEGYNNILYAGDIQALITHVLAENPAAQGIDWIGTSMGGIIGMFLAAQEKTSIRRLVLNDIGAVIPWAALERIGTYVGTDPSFATLAEVEQALRLLHANFGALTDKQWRHMAEHGHRRKPDGSLGLGYDPAIKVMFEKVNNDLKGTDADLWALWDKITPPVLLVRGAQSDLLLRSTADEMLTRGPTCSLFEVANAGHAPALMADDQVQRVVEFLTA